MTALLTGCTSTSESALPPSIGASDSIGSSNKELASGVNAGTAQDRSVIKNGNIGLETEDISKAKAQLTQVALKYQGLIENWSQQSNNSGELYSVHATVRVPADSIDKAIDDISAMGDVLSVYVSNTDVTTQVIDIDARVASLTASVARLQKLMAESKSTSDLLAAETALSQRQAELESLISQQKYLKDQVGLATINVDVYAQGRGPISTPTSFADGIKEGWKALTVFFTGTMVFLGMTTPWLIVILPLGAIAFFVVRRIRRKNTK